MTIKDADKASNIRVLIIDDNPSIHLDFGRILTQSTDRSELDAMAASLFGSTVRQTSHAFELTSAYRGEEALELVRTSLQKRAPFALAFVDVRMPNGWDGIETLARIWQEDPAIQAVLCTAYSDYLLSDIAARFKKTDSFLILTKPFDPIEVQQMAFALTHKWGQQVEIETRSLKASIQHAASKALLESGTLSEGIRSILGIVGRTLRCQLGAFWLLEKTGPIMRCQSQWKESPEALGGLEAAIWKTSRSSEEGLMRRAIESDVPSWNEDNLAAQDDPLLAAANRAGMRAVVYFPIRLGAVTLGIMELFAAESIGRDKDRIAIMVEICATTGTFIRSKQIESTLRASEAKNRALLHAIPDSIFLIGSDGTCLDLKATRGGDQSLDPVTGASAEKRVIDVFSTDIALQIMEHVGRAIGDNTPQTFEYEETAGEDSRSQEVRVVGSGPTEALIVVRDITERKRTESEAAQLRMRDELIRSQAEVLAELSAPLIPLRDDVVVMPLIGALDLRRARKIQEVLVEGVSSRQALTTLLDFTGVPSLSEESASELLRMAQAVRLLGSEISFTGVRPEVARALVEMGVDLQGIVTHGTLQTGVTFALQQRKRR